MIFRDVVTHKAELATVDAHRKRMRSIHAAGTGFGLVSGVIFPIFGGLLTEVGRTHGQHLFKFYVGVTLLALTLPLLIFGITCLSRFVNDSTPFHEHQGPVRSPFNLPFSRRRSHRLAIGAMGSVLLFSAATAQAQQTIFNVPSTDVLDKGKVYGEATSWRARCWTSYS